MVMSKRSVSVFRKVDDQQSLYVVHPRDTNGNSQGRDDCNRSPAVRASNQGICTEGEEFKHSKILDQILETYGHVGVEHTLKSKNFSALCSRVPQGEVSGGQGRLRPPLENCCSPQCLVFLMKRSEGRILENHSAFSVCVFIRQDGRLKVKIKERGREREPVFGSFGVEVK